MRSRRGAAGEDVPEEFDMATLGEITEAGVAHGMTGPSAEGTRRACRPDTESRANARSANVPEPRTGGCP